MKVRDGRFLTVAGVVLRVEPLPTCLHTLALVQEEPTRTGGALGHRGTPAWGAGAVAGWEGGRRKNWPAWPLTFDSSGSHIRPTSTSAVGVQVVARRAVRNALPMMQGSPWNTACTPRVVRETGGTGGVTGCEPQRVSVNDTRSKRLNASGSIL